MIIAKKFDIFQNAGVAPAATQQPQANNAEESDHSEHHSSDSSNQDQLQGSSDTKLESNDSIITGEPMEDKKNNTTIDKNSDFLHAGGARVDYSFGSILICSITVLVYFSR